MKLEPVSILNEPVAEALPPDSPSGCQPVPPWVLERCPRHVSTDRMPLPGGPRQSHTPGTQIEVSHRSGTDAALISATLRGCRALPADQFQSAVTASFLAVFAALARTSAPHAVRMWNFIPGIHDPLRPGEDRYRVFNAGRFDAFQRWLQRLAAASGTGHAQSLPAATGVGHFSDDLVIHALGARSPGQPVENPLQTPAYLYSSAHGPRPPCFSRATVTNLGDQSQRPTLLVSGTGSIRGEASRHEGDLVGQFAESIENIERLAASIQSPPGFALSGVETARVYHTTLADGGWISQAIRAKLPRSAAIEVLHGVICRPELLVEIEATIGSPAAEHGRVPTCA